jgi:ATP-binding cassette subfamily F protein 3
LADALNKYPGSYILVSHDRYFISKTANKIWEIVDHKIKEFKGTYQEWVEWNERMASRKAEVENGRSGNEELTKSEVRNKKPEPSSTQQSTTKIQSQNTNPNIPLANAPINRELQKELQRQQKKLVNLEEDINKALQEKTRLEQALGLPESYSDKKKFLLIENDLKKAVSTIEQLNKQYEQLFEKVMELEMQFAG